MTGVEIVFNMTKSEFASFIHGCGNPKICTDCGDIGEHANSCRTCGAWTLHRLEDALASGLIELVGG